MPLLFLIAFFCAPCLLISNDASFHHNREVLSKYDAIVICSLGKTGTTSLFHLFGGLTGHETIPHSRHCLQQGKALHCHLPSLVKKLVKEGKKLLVINLTRNLFDRNMSHFFANIDKEGRPGYLDKEDNLLDPDKYTLADFIQPFRNFNLQVINIFERFYSDFYKVFSFNVFNVQFDFKKSFLFRKTNKADILVLRYEDLDEWPQIFKKALDLKNITIPKYNSSTEKWYETLYRKFKAVYSYSQEEIDLMRSTTYMQFFYKEKEIEQFIQKHNG